MSDHTPGTFRNEDRQLWQACPEDPWSPSIHVTKNGEIGINVGGFVIVKYVEYWHQCVNACKGINPEAVPDLLEALEMIIDPSRGEEFDQYDIDTANEAIAKAKGETS